MCLAHVVVTLWITSQVYFPLRHSSHRLDGTSLSEMVMPVMRPSSTMQVTALVWRWPRQQCQRSREAEEEVRCMVKAWLGGCVMSMMCESNIAALAVTVPETYNFIT